MQSKNILNISGNIQQGYKPLTKILTDKIGTLITDENK